MTSSSRSPFALITRSLAVVTLALAGACQAPEAIEPEELPGAEPAAAPAAAPAAKAAAKAAEAAAVPEEACDMGQRKACDCQHDDEQPVIGEAVEQVTLGAAPVRGPADAPVTIVVFSDFQCPFSAGGVSTLRALEEEYPGKLRIAYKHMPLRKIHPLAEGAARTAIAANAQGKFWAFHDALFTAGGKLSAEMIEEHAADAGLDIARLRRDAKSAEVEATLAADEAEAKRLGLQGTPSFFVNGHRIKGAVGIEVFRKAIDHALTY